MNSLRELSVPWLEQELERGDYRRPIAAAIAAGDAESAATAARAALTPPAGLSPTSNLSAYRR